MIELISGFVLAADEYCYSVGVPTQDKAGTVRIRNPKYYGTISQAIQGTLERVLLQGVASGEITTLRQFAEELNRQRTALDELLAPLETGGEAPQKEAHGLTSSAEGRYTPGHQDGSTTVSHA